MPIVKRALISVSDKRGVVEFARRLASLNIEIISTGGTAAALAHDGLKVVEVAKHTGFAEMLDGRVKTLHPRVHAGILARREVEAHMRALEEHDIPPIDLVAVNLYPFEQTVARPDVDLATAIENIDIGGATLVRAAAKNFAGVVVVVDPDDYSVVLDALASGDTDRALRFELARKAFEHVARYDAAIANYLGRLELGAAARDFPRTFTMQFRHAMPLRYGENPHQRAAFYRELDPPAGSVATARQLQGKELSFNNIADTDAALECVKSFGQAACVIVKHANPCGVAIADNILEAYRRAYDTDPTSAFGGIIAFNRALDAATAREIVDRQFVEVIVAPAVAADAKAVLAGKSNVRVLECGTWGPEQSHDLDFRRVVGGLLLQDHDHGQVAAADLKTVTRRAPSTQELHDLLFAWNVVKFVKSNAIVYCRDGRTIGVGSGQSSRVHSARIAAIKAAEVGLEVRDSVMASDAFFPFRDGLDQAAEAGVTAVIQPGGSMRDREVIEAADQHGIAMVFTGMRHFRH